MVGLLRGTLMDGEILTNLATLFCVDPVGEDFSSPLYWQRFPWLLRYLLFYLLLLWGPFLLRSMEPVILRLAL